MAMQQRMGWMNRSSFVVFVVLLCALAAVSSEERNKDEEVFLRQIVDPASGEIDKDLAELLLTNCRQDFTRLKEAVKDIDKWFLVETSGSAEQVNSNFQSLAKENIHKIISVPHHPLKRTLSDCLGKSYIVSKTSGEEGGSRIWYAKYLDSLYPRTSALRRHLSIKLLESTAEAPSPAPQQAPSPSPQPAPSPDANHQFPAESPHSTFFPPDVSNLSSPPPPASGSSDSSQSVQESKKTNKSVVIAVAVTASTTFVVAALFFLCCSKACRKGSRLGQNDERPLLSLSLSNFSVGSAEKPFASGNSIKEENTRYQSFGNNSIHHKKGSSLDGDFYNESDTLQSSMHGTPSVGAAYGVAKFPPESFNSSSNVNGQVLPFPLKPSPGRVGTTGSVMLPLKPPPGRADPLPPGRVGTTGSVMLPLKPPPGRADPLPPEPPSSFRPPPRTAAPPLPPAPPSLLKPSSAAVPRPPGPPPPPPPPVPPGGKTGTHPPPPPPKSGVPPPRPPPPIAPGAKVPRPPLGSKHSSSATSSVETGPEVEADAPKAKLKPFFWDKVLASPDQSMVWHQIKSGSFQFNEEMIETLFGYNAVDRNKNERRKESSSQDPSPQYIQIFESKRSQNLSILLRAVNVTTEEVCDALNEGNELPSELLQTLLKMAPTAEEELKLRLFSGELAQLGPAERFLKALINIPFAFKRLETLLFMSSLQEEATLIKESFATLEVACKELKNSRLFLKLLEAVLKTGNRMNDGTFRGGAQAFKLDTLLKLSDVKGIDGKTTLLHFVVQEIIRSEGVRAARAAKESRSSLPSIKSDDLLEETSHETEEHYRSLGLQVVSGLGNELGNVKKAAIIDADSLTGSVAKLGHQLIKTRDFLNSDMKSLGDDGRFYQTLKSFVENAGVDVTWLLEEEKRIMRLVKSTGDYFHGKAGKDEGVRLFVIVRDFLVMLDKACKEVKDAPKKPTKTQRKDASSVAASSDTRQPPDLHQRLFPAITDRRIDYSSSDDDNP